MRWSWRSWRMTDPHFPTNNQDDEYMLSLRSVRTFSRSLFRGVLALLSVVAAIAPAGVAAQDPAPAVVAPIPPATPAGFPRVFLDCQQGPACDRNHLRTEIQFVNWAQDRADSDVHVIVTTEGVG